jgi:DNA (cytosine-5)-methyltransferase 1
MKPEPTPPIPLLSFFTGGGLLDLGFELEKRFEVVWTSEFNPHFAKLYAGGMTTYRKRHTPGREPATISHIGPVQELTDDVILEQAFPTGKPKFFGIIGGPPCQDFSVNGQRAGFAGDKGNLTSHFCERILKLRPSFFVIENVTGLLQSNHRQGFALLLSQLRVEYVVDFDKLNALDYGVPQSRERLFVIGLRRDIVQQPINELSMWADWHLERAAPYRTHSARTCYQWPSIREDDAVPQPPTGEQLSLCVASCLVSPEEEILLSNATERFNLKSQKACATMEGDVRNRSFKRLHRYRYSPTACYGNNEVHLHPFLNQRLSVREVLRIQSVPEEYELPADVAIVHKFKMIGNGVPVKLAQGVARTLTRLLKQYCNDLQPLAKL